MHDELSRLLRHPKTREQTKKTIVQVLRASGGVLLEAARRLGLHRVTLRRLLNRHRLDVELQAIRLEVERKYGLHTHRRGFASHDWNSRRPPVCTDDDRAA